MVYKLSETKISDPADITALQSFMTNKEKASLEDIKENITKFADYGDGKLHQLALDSGFLVKI